MTTKNANKHPEDETALTPLSFLGIFNKLIGND